MLAPLEQEDAHADVRHIIRDIHPAGIDRRQPHMTLQQRQIGEQEPVLEPADEAQEHADRKIEIAPPQRMIGVRGRSGDERLLVRLEHIFARRRAVSHGALRPASSL